MGNCTVGVEERAREDGGDGTVWECKTSCQRHICNMCYGLTATVEKKTGDLKT
jgi:hypothetical protein